MKCPKCSGLGSVVRADPKSGSFSIQDCDCQQTAKLLGRWFIESNQNRVYVVRHVEQGLLIITEYYRSGKCYKRNVNQMLFEKDIEVGILLSFDKPSYSCQKCNKITADYLINHRFICHNCKELTSTLA